MRKANSVLVTSTLVGIAAGVLVTAPSTAFAAGASTSAPLSCSARDVKLTNIGLIAGEAHWTKCTSGGYTTVTGWVKDDAADGKCAQVYAFFSNGAYHESAKACPSGTTKSFTWQEAASGADVYARLIS